MPTLSDEVSAFLRHHGLRLNTDLGQHFLIDEDALECIVETAGITEEDRIVEIGPGIGILTRELARRARKVQAVEIDERLIPLLKDFLSGEESGLLTRVTVIRGNALSVPLPEEPYKVVANIPYHITSPLLRHVYLESKRRPETMTLLIQKEVAEKICSEDDRGLLTILVGLFGTPRYVCGVGKGAFLPPPAVDSAVIHIVSHGEPLADAATIERVFSLTKLAFGQRRKMLSNSLGSLPYGTAILAATGIDPSRRPQTLSVEEWISLAKEAEKEG